MAEQPLSERDARSSRFRSRRQGSPTAGDILRCQAAVATTSGSSCQCGCASIALEVDRSTAPQARLDLPTNLVEAVTADIAGVHQAWPLLFYGDDGGIDPHFAVTDDDLKGAIGLILWVEDGWLGGIEVWSAGNFADPSMFPPAELFHAPRAVDGSTSVACAQCSGMSPEEVTPDLAGTDEFSRACQSLPRTGPQGPGPSRLGQRVRGST